MVLAGEVAFGCSGVFLTFGMNFHRIPQFLGLLASAFLATFPS